MTKTIIGPNWQNHPEWGFATHQIHVGFIGDPATGAQTVPICATNVFHFPNVQAVIARLGLQGLGPTYSCLTNPTSEALEGRLAFPEGRMSALVTPSGQSTITLALLTLASPGKNIVASPSIYGGIYNLLARTLAWLGLKTHFVADSHHLVNWKDLTDENTIAYYSEAIPNPQGDVLDLEPLANLAHDFGVPLVVDNTVPTPYLCRSIEWDADIVVYPATKYLGGYGPALLGAIVDAGRFGFADQAVVVRFPGFNQPDDSYHGVVYTRDFGAGGVLGANLAFILRVRVEGLCGLGLTASPFAMRAVGLGMDTLSLWVVCHVENTRAVAEHSQSLVDGGVVQTVRWSSLPSPSYYRLAQKYISEGAGAALDLNLTGGLEAGKRFIDSPELLANAANIGDVRSLAVYPASTTHSQSSGAELATQGISAGAVWISVGIEDSQDIIADTGRGLAATKAVWRDASRFVCGSAYGTGG